MSEIDSNELTEWRAYYDAEPFGELIADQRHGIAVSTLANINRDHKKRPETYKAADFIYWHPSNRETGPVLHKDAEAQSSLIKRMFLKLSSK